jgi:hypothetical protein
VAALVGRCIPALSTVCVLCCRTNAHLCLRYAVDYRMSLGVQIIVSLLVFAVSAVLCWSWVLAQQQKPPGKGGLGGLLAGRCKRCRPPRSVRCFDMWLPPRADDRGGDDSETSEASDAGQPSRATSEADAGAASEEFAVEAGAGGDAVLLLTSRD